MFLLDLRYGDLGMVEAILMAAGDAAGFSTTRVVSPLVKGDGEGVGDEHMELASHAFFIVVS